MTGFVINEHCIQKKKYNIGDLLVCKVLDVDIERKILDLSHSNHFSEFSVQTSENINFLGKYNKRKVDKIQKKLHQNVLKFPRNKAFEIKIELVKESYAIVSFTHIKYVIGAIPIR